jgi:gamma-glutamyltranspeptidase
MPETVYFEGPDRFDPAALRRLEEMGYPIQVGGTWSDVEAIQIDPETGVRTPATDPRGDGAALAY